MKKIMTMAKHAVYGMLMVFSVATLTSCNGGGDGKVVFASTKVPLPLGRYVQLSRPYATYTLTEPDGNGNGEMIVDFDFEILRHVPGLEFLSFRAKPKNRIEEEVLYIKFKRDQQAVEELAKAINVEDCDRVSIKFNTKYCDKTKREVEDMGKFINGKEFKITDSSLYLFVPQSNVHISGVNSQSIKVKEPVTIRLLSDDNSSIYLDFSVKVLSDVQYNHQTIVATIRTEDGNFEATMESRGYFSFPNVNRYYILQREMDKLLSSPVEIYIDMK
ncbi:MAG: hypothetical protein K2L55_08200 [Muribaculaceae bacterium]|nr:hypothetical protein [Muribaculaceae bacterium]